MKINKQTATARTEIKNAKMNIIIETDELAYAALEWKTAIDTGILEVDKYRKTLFDKIQNFESAITEYEYQVLNHEIPVKGFEFAHSDDDISVIDNLPDAQQTIDNLSVLVSCSSDKQKQHLLTKLAKSIPDAISDLGRISSSMEIALNEGLAHIPNNPMDTSFLKDINNRQKYVDSAKEEIGLAEYEGDLNIGSSPAVGEYLTYLEYHMHDPNEHHYEPIVHKKLIQRSLLLFTLGLINDSQAIHLQRETT